VGGNIAVALRDNPAFSCDGKDPSILVSCRGWQIENGKTGPDRQKLIGGVVDNPRAGQMLRLDVVGVKSALTEDWRVRYSCRAHGVSGLDLSLNWKSESGPIS